jgi:hypothetical protein
MEEDLKIIYLLREIFDKDGINEYCAIIEQEIKLFNELADPNFSYDYNEVSPNRWQFQDKYGNNIGVEFNTSVKQFESYYLIKNLQGEFVKVYDYEKWKPGLDPISFQGGSDQNRSDTICKILRDEVLPRYLVNKRYSTIILHPLNDYRYQIFMKCAEVCKIKYAQIEIRPQGKEIILINK